MLPLFSHLRIYIAALLWMRGVRLVSGAHTSLSRAVRCGNVAARALHNERQVAIGGLCFGIYTYAWWSDVRRRRPPRRAAGPERMSFGHGPANILISSRHGGDTYTDFFTLYVVCVRIYMCVHKLLP